MCAGTHFQSNTLRDVLHATVQHFGNANGRQVANYIVRWVKLFQDSSASRKQMKHDHGRLFKTNVKQLAAIAKAMQS